MFYYICKYCQQKYQTKNEYIGTVPCCASIKCLHKHKKATSGGCNASCSHHWSLRGGCECIDISESKEWDFEYLRLRCIGTNVMNITKIPEDLSKIITSYL